MSTVPRMPSWLKRIARNNAARNNAAFNASTDAQKRVAVAKDVIAQVKANKYIPMSSVYFSFEHGVTGMHGKRVVPHKALCDDNVKCTCCGIGSMFVSAVKLKRSSLSGYGYSPIDSNNATLRKLFSVRQLATIEAAFEMWNADDCAFEYESLASVKITKVEAERACVFGQRYKTDTDRLLAIMRNIVRNGGAFVPYRKRRMKKKMATTKLAIKPVRTSVRAPRLHVRIDGTLAAI